MTNIPQPSDSPPDAGLNDMSTTDLIVLAETFYARGYEAGVRRREDGCVTP